LEKLEEVATETIKSKLSEDFNQIDNVSMDA
jgi:hypothetical protein